MKILLDTHIILWHSKKDPKLPNRIAQIINNQENEIFVSMASFYEIAIKVKIGKLELHNSIHQFYQDTIKDLITILPISERYLSTYHQIPLLEEHRDPFDRLIIATAFADKLSIITADNKFPLYSDFIDIIW